MARNWIFIIFTISVVLTFLLWKFQSTTSASKKKFSFSAPGIELAQQKFTRRHLGSLSRAATPTLHFLTIRENMLRRSRLRNSAPAFVSESNSNGTGTNDWNSSDSQKKSIGNRVSSSLPSSFERSISEDELRPVNNLPHNSMLLSDESMMSLDTLDNIAELGNSSSMKRKKKRMYVDVGDPQSTSPSLYKIPAEWRKFYPIETTNVPS